MKTRRDDLLIDTLSEEMDSNDYRDYFWELFHFVNLKNPKLLDLFIKYKMGGYTMEMKE